MRQRSLSYPEPEVKPPEIKPPVLVESSTQRKLVVEMAKAIVAVVRKATKEVGDES